MDEEERFGKWGAFIGRQRKQKVAAFLRLLSISAVHEFFYQLIGALFPQRGNHYERLRSHCSFLKTIFMNGDTQE